jgi:hypothetical protein
MQIVSSHLTHGEQRIALADTISRRPAISPALTGMIMALFVLGREPLLVALRRLLIRPKRSPTEQAARMLSLPSLRAAILGRGKQSLVNMFGPPQAAAHGGQGQRPVWYYPVHPQEHLAMAISFEDERAVHVEFFHAPL